METLKKSLSKNKLSKNNDKNINATQVFTTKNSGFTKPKVRNSNPIKIISIAWRKAKRLNDQIGKIIQ
jgi:hypothetical protein